MRCTLIALSPLRLKHLFRHRKILASLFYTQRAFPQVPKVEIIIIWALLAHRLVISPVMRQIKKTASVALGLFLGVRVALGPKEVVQDNKRVQFSSEIRSTRAGGHNHALAIASYRACKNNQALKSQ